MFSPKVVSAVLNPSSLISSEIKAALVAILVLEIRFFGGATDLICTSP